MRTAIALAAVLSFALPVSAQTAAQAQARTAQLPPEQRAYERYRAWFVAQSQDVQRASDVMDRYRAYLKAQGFTSSDIESQIKLVGDRGDELEAQLWNRVLTAEKPRFNTNPNAFLVDMVKTRAHGAALDVGMGQGRNAIWLAQQGWDVTGFDPADKAVALANKTAEGLGLHLKTEITTAEKYDFGEKRWDLVVLSYVGARGMNERVARALKPGGLVVVEAFHRDATKAHPIGDAVVFDTGELVKLFPDLRVVRYEEPLATADFGLERVRVVRYCAEKPQ